jgi:hypothetical protein
MDINKPAMLGLIVCGAIFCIALGILIGAVIFRAACALYNKMAGGRGSPSSVPEPSFGKAMGIVLLTTLVNGVVGFGIGMVVGIAGVAVHADQKAVTILAQLVSFPVGILVGGGMNAAMLPTTFGRGILVALCQLLIVLFIVIVLGVIFGGLALVAYFLQAPR